MFVDSAAQQLREAQPLIEQLSEREREANKAKKARDRDARRQAEQRAQNLRDRLLRQADASLIYLYLAASGVASDVDFRTAWQNDVLKNPKTPSEQLQRWGLASLHKIYWADPVPDLTILPPYSFSLKFKFKLAQPYLSKDDNAFYIVDNPIVRDKVFRLPMVRPSSWKGSLCAAIWQLRYRKESDERVQRLFGDIRGDDKGQAGRLRFFPAFFTQTGLEIINPHDRKTKVGQNPILFECVPQNAEGTFTLLYVPFDRRIGKEEDETRRQVAEDLKLVAEGIEAMFTVYGFGAKTSSGFGCAVDELVEPEQGSLSIAAPGLKLQAGRTPEQAIPVKPETPDVLRQFRKEYPDEDFTLKPNEWRKQHHASQKERDRYREAKAADREYRQALESYKAQLEHQEADQSEDDAGLFTEPFTTLTELTSLATSIGNALKARADT